MKRKPFRISLNPSLVCSLIFFGPSWMPFIFLVESTRDFHNCLFHLSEIGEKGNNNNNNKKAALCGQKKKTREWGREQAKFKIVIG